MWKKRIIQIVWALAGVGVIVLLGAAMQQKNHKACEDVKVEIIGAEEHMFIDEKDVRNIIDKDGEVKGKNMAAIDLRSMEEALEKDPWVKNAELFFDNNGVLNISIEERQPIARVFTKQGTSFYLDTAGYRLPLSDKLSARVPVFTGFTSDKKIMAASDSALLGDVVKVAKFIVADSFWMAQVAQIDITSNGNFEMTPVVGDQVIVIGDADDLQEKFDRLFTFYKQAWLQNGINKYEKIDVQFDGQVVGVKRGSIKATIDTTKASQMIEELIQQPHDTAQIVSTRQVNGMNQ
jgi:cell division protein FtsQ